MLLHPTELHANMPFPCWSKQVGGGAVIGPNEAQRIRSHRLAALGNPGVHVDWCVTHQDKIAVRILQITPHARLKMIGLSHPWCRLDRVICEHAVVGRT